MLKDPDTELVHLEDGETNAL